MHGSIERLREYVEQVTGGASLRSVAARTSIEPSTLSRQFARESVPVETVVAIARAYRGDLLLGLVIGGFITQDEAAEFTSRGSLADATDLQLAQETLQRMRALPRADLTGVADATEERRLLDAASGPHLHTRRFAPDAAASVSSTSIYDEAVASEDQP